MRQASIQVGTKKGYLTVVSERYRIKNHSWVDCVCDCGADTNYRCDKLIERENPSCGCQNQNRHKVGGFGHRSPEHNSWRAMIFRCHNAETSNWPNYGGRGITVCDRWRYSFATFCEDMGRRPEGTTLDRINPWGNYEPGNCRWADAVTQNNNQRHHQPNVSKLSNS